MTRVIDLSVPTEESPSEPLSIEVRHEDHSQSIAAMAHFFGCEESEVPQGLGWANDTVRMHAHAGTHVDAPWHYFPTTAGKKAPTIDELPLSWFYGNGVVIDMRHKERGSVISAEEIETALQKINYRIKPCDIVLIQTGADKYWGRTEYFDAGCGMGRESTLLLIELGVRVMGIDAWGWDRPFWAMKEEFTRNRNGELLWAAHRVGIDHEYYHIEKLANLDSLPQPFGFKVACFPIKLSGGSAGWCRAVAILEE